MSRLNWRQILIHFIATWFFIQSFFLLSSLHDLKGCEVFTQKWQSESFDRARLLSEINWLYTSPYVGLLVGFSISLFITIKKKWFWVNSAIVLVLSYFLKRFDFDGWHYLKFIFLTPGQYFDHHSALYYLSNGIPMLTIGLLLFFLKLTNRFIDNGNIKSQN